MLDPRVRTILLDYQRGRCNVEQAAQALLEVRRATGCLQLHLSATSSPAEHALAARYNDLVEAEFGAP